MRLSWLLVLLSVCPVAAAEPARRPQSFNDPVQDKNFFVLTQLSTIPQLSNELTLHSLAGNTAARARQALQCADLNCYAAAFTLPEGEIADAGQALKELAIRDASIRAVASGPMRESGLFQRYASLNDGELLARAWADAAAGLNYIIGVFAGGKPARSADIDGPGYDIKADGYRRILQSIADVVDDASAQGDAWFQPTLRFAMRLLDANRRNEAGRHEPLDRGENAAALRRFPAIDWSAFPYSAIIIPGSGTTRLDVALSPIGKLRLELAVRRFRRGQAPLLIVSGGYVHPNQTPYAEAIEMKRSLMADFHIAEEAILVDPHARHTTTNLRNAARILYRSSAPFDKPVLVVTDLSQTNYIEGAGFADRCRKELGYLPWRSLTRKAKFEIEMLLSLDSLHADARDPLDP